MNLPPDDEASSRYLACNLSYLQNVVVHDLKGRERCESLPGGMRRMPQSGGVIEGEKGRHALATFHG